MVAAVHLDLVLLRLEVFNWGTFDGRVWTLFADGRNALLQVDAPVFGAPRSSLSTT